MSKFLNLATAGVLIVMAAPAFAESYGLGREALPEEIAAWDLDVSPDGTGLPPGSGSVEDGEAIFADACGAQRLPNGNTVITSYHASGDKVKLFEVTREKKVVWRYSGMKTGFHHFQILTTNGKPLKNNTWK